MEYVVLFAVLAVPFAYVLARAASYAYFRTKMEHFKGVQRELRKDEKNHG